MEKETIYYYETNSYEETIQFLKHLEDNTEVLWMGDRKPLHNISVYISKEECLRVFKIYNDRLVFSTPNENYLNKHESSKKSKTNNWINGHSLFPIGIPYLPYIISPYGI